MADLPSIANRYNDVEVAANAPVTESLVRKGGSNDNFILDFLGAADGSTVAAGILSDLVNAVNLCDGHTMDQQISLPNSGTAATIQTIGTYTPVKYVNQVFYWVLRNDSGFPNAAVNFNWGFGADYALLNGVNLNQHLVSDVTGTFGQVGGDRAADIDFNYDSFNINSSFAANNQHTTRQFSKMINIGEYTYGVSNGGRMVVPICVLDWRDGGTQNLTMRLSTSYGNASSVEIYRQYVLDIKSAGF